ncbi:MAG: 16S rRNA (guanine(966)-N(2))-methyltransferase RsmD [Planctomycetota bacterium]
MRVISGSAGGTALDALPKSGLRPMLDRVKEALFNILQWELEDARVLDLFSGSGALGLEALSRGARSCLFVESDPELARLIEANALKCRLRERCRVLPEDVFRLPDLPLPGEGLPAGIAFVDPPYAVVDDPNRRAELFELLEGLAGSWIAARALLVLHHEPIPHAIWPAERLVETDKRIYGRSQLTFFEVGEGEGP